MTDMPDLTKISSTHLTCGNCGADIEAGDVLCASCGALLAAYQAPSGSSTTSAAITTTAETSIPASPGASAPVSPVDTGQHDLYPAPASPAQPEITTTAPAADAKPVASATNPGSSPPAQTPTTATATAPTTSAPRVIFPASGARSVSEPAGTISSTSASSLSQTHPPPQRSTPRDREQPRSNGDLPEASKVPQPRPQPPRPVRQPVIANNESPELPASSFPQREPVPPVRLPRFSGRQLGQVVPFVLIALVIITRVPRMMALLGLLAVVGVAALFLYSLLKVTRGTRRRTTDMPHDRDYYRNHHRRRKGR
ncbi:MAG: hypothetical protein ACR2OE_18390 [Thermomicrobiales bacterium]